MRALQRLCVDETGFTLIELLLVMVIVAALLAIGVTSYLGFKQRAEKAVVRTNVRDAVPAMEAYYVDNKTYATVTLAALKAINSGIASVSLSNLSVGGYTISFTKGGCWASVTGPGGQITTNC